MSRSQSSHAKETFQQAFKYDAKRTPYGISLDELYKSCAYIESSPITFSYSCAGPRNCKLEDQYQAYRAFADKHSSKPALRKALFPLFCHVVMRLRRANNETAVANFVRLQLGSLLPDNREEATLFVSNQKKYEEYSCLFETQRFIIKIDLSSWNLLNEFINEARNCELRALFVRIITLELEWPETDDKETHSRFFVESDRSDLAVINCRVSNSTSAVISKDFSGIYAVMGDVSVCKIDPSSSRRTTLYNHSSVITTMSLSSEGKVLMTGDINGVINVWSQSGSFKRSIRSSIWCSAFTPRGGVFATGSSDQLIRLYDVTGQTIRECAGHREPVTSVGFHPNCSLMGSLSTDPSVRIWDLREASTVRLFRGKSSENSVIAFSNNGKLMAFFDGELCVCDIGENTVIVRSKIDVSDVVYLCFSEDSTYLYAVSSNSRLFSLGLTEEKYPVREIPMSRGHVIGCSLNRPSELRIITSHEL